VIQLHNLKMFVLFIRVKIRFTMSDIKEVMCFLEKIQQENLKEPEFVFYKLFFDNAFIFAASPNEVLKHHYQLISSTFKK